MLLWRQMVLAGSISLATAELAAAESVRKEMQARKLDAKIAGVFQRMPRPEGVPDSHPLVQNGTWS